MTPPLTPPWRGLFCNRTLNLRAIKAIGYDMDYTLVHYDVKRWEQRVFDYTKERLLNEGWPVADAQFERTQMMRGLIVDTAQGNIVKANRFGYVKVADHGTRPLSFEEQRRIYARTIIDLEDKRYVFLNTLFGLSTASLYAQLVDAIDRGECPKNEHLGYAELFRCVQQQVDETHMEGLLKAEVVAHPEQFVVLDPDTPKALLDQRAAGKKLLLITNSEWGYTRDIMSYSFDRYLPAGQTWRDLFDLIIVGSRKPNFFTERPPLFDLADETEGLLRPNIGGLTLGKIYFGGCAAQVEACLGLDGEEILYVGDHIFGDVHVSKSVRRWRTCVILRELEDEIRAVEAFRPQQEKLDQLMAQKEAIEREQAWLRLQEQRQRVGLPVDEPISNREMQRRFQEMREAIERLDAEASLIAEQGSQLLNARFGLLMRTGNDKSHMARQVERHADIYTSRVSNFEFATPYAYIRSIRGSLPHDR